MSISRKMGLLALVGLLCNACLTANQGEDEAEPIEQIRAQVQRNNGVSLNGVSLNGVSLNGVSLNGVSLNGVSLNGHFANGVSLNGVSLNGVSLNGVSLNGVSLNGVSLNGTLLGVQFSGGSKVLTGPELKGLVATVIIPDLVTQKPVKYLFRIDNVILDTANKNFKDVWLYQVSYQIEGTQAWQSMCKDYNGNPAPLIPVKGSYWNENTGARVDDANSGTLACYEGAVGKCISVGYRPWATAQQCTGSGKSKKCTTISLKDHHQACTRMMRADYCGDGKSYTVNGTLLDIFDYLQPPVQLQEEKWQMEARWTPTGASCLTERRHEEIKFPGCKGRKFKECEPYCAASDRGLVVSTFNDGTPVKK
jgi:hypothetical protein